MYIHTVPQVVVVGPGFVWTSHARKIRSRKTAAITKGSADIRFTNWTGREEAGRKVPSTTVTNISKSVELMQSLTTSVIEIPLILWIPVFPSFDRLDISPSLLHFCFHPLEEIREAIVPIPCLHWVKESPILIGQRPGKYWTPSLFPLVTVMHQLSPTSRLFSWATHICIRVCKLTPKYYILWDYSVDWTF